MDAAALERLASELPTQAAVADALGMSRVTLIRKLMGSPELRRAWEAGHSRLEAASATGRKAKASAALSPPTAPGPARSPVVRPEPAFTSGTVKGRVLAAVRAGHRTFAKLMTATGVGHAPVVEAVTALMQARRLVAREVGGERCHFLAEEACPVKPAAGEVCRG